MQFSASPRSAGLLMAAVMQRDCAFHGALRGKTHVATDETHANDTRMCAS